MTGLQEARRIAEQLERLASDLSLGLRIGTDRLEADENALLRAAVLLKEHKERERLLKEEITHGRALLADQAGLREALDFIASDATIVPAGCPEPWRSTLIEWVDAANHALGTRRTPPEPPACPKCGAPMEEPRRTLTGVCPTHGVQHAAPSPDTPDDPTRAERRFHPSWGSRRKHRDKYEGS